MKITDNRVRLPLAKPWADMTAQEQAHHLVIEHGFDVDYFWRDKGPLSALDTNDAVIAAFTDPLIPDAGGESHPHPDGRNGWHDSDHEGDAPHGGADKHRHTHG